MKELKKLISDSLSKIVTNQKLSSLESSLPLLFDQGSSLFQLSIPCFVVFEDDKECFVVETGNSEKPSGITEEKYHYICFVSKDRKVVTIEKKEFLDYIKPFIKDKEKAFFYMNKTFDAMAIKLKKELIYG